MILKKIYAILLSSISAAIGVDAAKRFDAKFRFHKKINLASPATLSDKITFIELHDQSPLAAKCTDKYEVREYINQKGLKDILTPLIGGPWEDTLEIDFAHFPNSFVLKATHGCKMNYIVQDKRAMDLRRCQNEMKRWLSTTYGKYSLEPHYYNLPHRIYAEKYLGNAEKLVDYKVHCLNGEPAFILACSNRKADGDKAMKVTLDLFDTHWNRIDGLKSSGTEVLGNGILEKPGSLDKMLSVARTLSEDFKFVRVDLYELDGKIYFGELTFTPGAGVLPYLKPEFDLKMGEKLKL